MPINKINKFLRSSSLVQAPFTAQNAAIQRYVAGQAAIAAELHKECERKRK